jgi:hypothetical protein
LLVYAVLPELRNGLHAKYLMAHTASFLVAHLFLGIGQLIPDLHYVFCTVIGEATSVATFLGSRARFKNLAPLHDYIYHPLFPTTANPEHTKALTRLLSIIFKFQNLFHLFYFTKVTTTWQCKYYVHYVITARGDKDKWKFGLRNRSLCNRNKKL